MNAIANDSNIHDGWNMDTAEGVGWELMHFMDNFHHPTTND